MSNSSHHWHRVKKRPARNGDHVHPLDQVNSRLCLTIRAVRLERAMNRKRQIGLTYLTVLTNRPIDQLLQEAKNILHVNIKFYYLSVSMT